MRILISLLVASLLIACTTQGRLHYITAEGVHKSACETEYFGAPAVDKYAVEYFLSYCAQQAVAQGHTVVNAALLTLDLSIPPSPNGKPWTFELATKRYQAKQLTEKEYGYIIAHLDLALSQASR
ncbi:hypothetical protein [uncultured Ferrimonas sp.]|uniref:hypothetical protein n=1 Tax=uncultured Ferrimonas sp. TaxID=432640 RepID=UPI002626EA00|nr:hypothetical protein [uncultured Ferrimonas sp.]